MAKVNKLDITNFYDFGRANDPSNPNLSHRMYFDYQSALGSNKLMIADVDFNIISAYQAWPGSSIVAPQPVIIDKLDICVLNDQGLNSFPPVANKINPIYRLYLAERAIPVNVILTVIPIEIEYTDETGDFTPLIGDLVTNGTGASGYIYSNVPPPGVGEPGILGVYVTTGNFLPGDTITSGSVTALAGSITIFGETTIEEEITYNCSLLIVNQKFEIEFIIPLLEGFVPLQSLSADAICCSYDYGFNAQGNNQNYIWHMYVSDYTINPGTEFETIVPNCLLIVNEDFKVVCYQTPIP